MPKADHLKKATYTLTFLICISLWAVPNVLKLEETGYGYHFLLSLVFPSSRCTVKSMLTFVGAGEFGKFLVTVAMRHVSSSDLVLLLLYFLQKVELNSIFCCVVYKEKGGR